MLCEIRAFNWIEARRTMEQPKSWFDKLRMSASGDLRSTLGLLGEAESALCGALLGLVWEDPPAPDVAGTILRLDSTPPRDLALAVFGYTVKDERRLLGPLMERAADGDSEAAHELLSDRTYLSEGSEKVREIRRFLDLGAEEAKRLYLEVLRGWYEQVFRSREEATGQILERDAEAKRAMARRMTNEALIEVATGGLQYTPEPGIRRVLLVPHVALRPWNLLDSHEETYIVFYPVADESLEGDGAGPPARLLRLFRALDDEKRLRMLRVLAGGPASLQELATAVGVAKSTAHHHTVILRSAGLIRVGFEDEGRYSLRPDMLPEASRWLSDFVDRGRTR